MIPESIRNNPIKTLLSIVALISGIVTSVITVDSRYVHADELDDFKIEMNQKFEKTDKSISNIRRQQLQDKIFELNFLDQSGQARPIDKALLDRYRNELQELESN